MPSIILYITLRVPNMKKNIIYYTGVVYLGGGGVVCVVVRVHMWYILF